VGEEGERRVTRDDPNNMHCSKSEGVKFLDAQVDVDAVKNISIEDI
jgi:hypothetical protein